MADTRIRARFLPLPHFAAALVCLLGMSVPSAQTRQKEPGGLEELLSRYDRGEFQAVARALRDLPAQPPALRPGDREGMRLDPLFWEWLTVAPRWIATGSSGEAGRRRLVAASFALELANARPRVDWYLRYPYVAWGCGLLRHSPSGLPAERWWHHAAIAVMQDNDDWAHIMGGLWKQAQASSYLRRSVTQFIGEADQTEAIAGHLAHAKTAFPDEPRWRLNEAQYWEGLTVLLEAGGPVGIGAHQTSRAFREALVKAASGQKVGPPFGPIAKGVATDALDRLGRMPPVVQRYEALSTVPSLRAEAALHLGFLSLRLEEWDAAMAELRKVPTLTREPAVVSLSHHFMGWIFQQTGDRDDAIAAYRKALAAAPGTRSTSILLAAQLLDSGRKMDAYTMMHLALEARPMPGTFAPDAADSPPDLWPLYPRGDALVLPAFLTRLREVLK
jgi:hypothetical protein